MTWVPNPKRFNFSRPLIDLRLILSELKVRMSRNQYQDFALLLHSLNTMTLAARYRKYKAQCALEHMNSYQEKFTTRFFKIFWNKKALVINHTTIYGSIIEGRGDFRVNNTPILVLYCSLVDLQGLPDTELCGCYDF